MSRAHPSDRLKGLAVLLYLQGLSYGAVEDVLTSLGFPLGKTMVHRDIQAVGEKARRLRHAWLKGHAGKIRGVGGDPTRVRCQGEDVVVGVVVSAQPGLILNTLTLKAWLLLMLELVGAQVLITNDTGGFKEVADQAGVRHQICRRHVTS